MSKPGSARLKKSNGQTRRYEANSLDLDRPAVEQRDFHVYSSDAHNGTQSTHDITNRKYHHARTVSGTSQSGSFVHPFHQPPSDAISQRPFTPTAPTPSYRGSFVGSEYSNSAQALHESDENPRNNLRSYSTFSSYNNTSSHTAPALRLQTSSVPSSRLGQGSSSNLHTACSVRSPDLSSPTDTISPTSGMRTSIDRGFRLRSRSELDVFDQRESIRELRRKFDEKERIKDEKAAREEVKALEKQNLKEARRYERSHRRSNGSETGRPKRSRSDLATQSEKDTEFVSQDYNSAVPQPPPIRAEIVEPPQRSRTGTGRTTKKKTQSAWASFVMWLRTRILRMGRSRRT